VEAVCGLRITAAAGAVEIGVGETAPTTFSAAALSRNRWYHVELVAACDSGVGNDGAITLYVDGVSVATVGSLDQGAIGQGVLGVQDHLETTTGTLLFGPVLFDDAQLYPPRSRFDHHRTVSASQHIFVGPGVVDSAALVSTTAGNILRLYDTDTGNVNDAQGFVAELDLTAHTALEGPLYFERGCFAELTGTNPRGQVIVSRTNPYGPRYYSVSGIRHYGLHRSERANG
jgi:hypothetical protein